MNTSLQYIDWKIAENVTLSRENNQGLWVLAYQLSEDEILRLRIETGGAADLHSFTAEMQTESDPPVLLGTFDIAPCELFVDGADRVCPPEIESWEPVDEPDFLTIPDEYRRAFLAMVRKWGQLISYVVPVPTVPTAF